MYAQYRTNSGRMVVLLPILLVRPHERYDLEHAADLRARITSTGVFTHPITVDRQSMALLDGHHRFQAVRSIGCTYVPSVLVDYRHDDISVSAWRTNETVSQADVLQAAISGELMPVKTSRHQFRNPVGDCAVPLSLLCPAWSPADISAA